MKPGAQPTPSLTRIIAECIHSPPDPAAQKALQKYLKDGQYTDAVYLELLVQASARPLSEATVASCLDVIQQHLYRLCPSPGVLQQIVDCCQQLQAALPTATGLHRRLAFLQSAAAQYGAPPAATGSATPRPSGWWPASLAQQEEYTKSSGLPPSTFASAAAAGVPPGRVAAQGPWLSHSNVPDLGAGGAGVEAGGVWSAAAQTGTQAAGVPGWAVPLQPPGVGPSGRLAGADLEDCCLAAWEAGPSITPLLQGFPGMDESLMLTGLAVQEVAADADPDLLVRSQEEIVAIRRIQAGVTPDGIAAGWRQCTRSGGGGSSSRAPGPPTPYTLQEPLALAGEDVAAVVEVVCGPARPGAPSVLTGQVEGQEAQLAHWRVRSGGECLGLQCAAVLLRLMVDTWCRAGSEGSHPLVLVLLQQALHQPHPSYRSRAFDLLYNLSLHAALLVPGYGHRGASEGSDTVVGGGGLGRRATSFNHSRPVSRAMGGQPGPGGSSMGSSGSEGSPRATGYIQPPSPRGLSAAVAAAAVAAAVTPSGGAPFSTTPAAPASPRSRLGRGEHTRTSSFGQLDPTGSPLQQQQPAAAGDWDAVRGTASPQASWRGLGRLSPGLLGRLGEHDEAGGSSPGGSRGGSTPGSVVEGEGHQQQLHHLQQQQPGLGSEDGQGDEDEEAGLVMLEFLSWVRELLFDALVMVAQVGEPQEEVWAAALGCLLQLTTHAGHWVASEVVHLPLQAVQGLLQAAQQYNWSPELYCRLLQLASWLLYQDAAAADPAGKQEDSSKAAAVAAGKEGAPPAEGSAKAAGRVEAGPPAEAQGSSTDACSTSSSSRAVNRTSEPPLQQQQQQQQLQQAEVLPGGLVASQLVALGGPAVLVHHLAHAPSPGSQLCCLVPLVHALVPPGVDPGAMQLLLEALSASPASLAALAAALRSARPGLADPLLTAVSCCQDLDPQLASTVLLQLEELAVNLAVTGFDCGSANAQLAANAGWSAQVEAELAGAVAVTLQQLGGGQEAAATAAEAAWAWRALKALCWCRQTAAQEAARQWLQQLLASALQLALAGSIPLPLPPPGGAGTPQRGNPAQATAEAASGGGGSGGGASNTPAGSGAEALKDVLVHLVTRCPGGPQLLLAALELHVSSCKAAGLHPQGPALGTAAAPAPGAGVAAAAAAGDSSGGMAAASERGRAAAARSAIQGWVLVLQWLLAGHRSHCRAALQDLAVLLLRMVSVDALPPLGSVTASPAGSPTRVTLAGRVRSPSPARGGLGRRTKSERSLLTPPPSAMAAGAAEADRAQGGAVEGWGAPLAWQACQHQAFLFGQQEVPEQLAQVLARTPLAELLAALLAAPAATSARARGVTCRLVSPAEGPPLAPVSSRSGDVALALLLLLIGAALNDEESSWQEVGLEGIAQQVLSSCTDPRVCYVTSRFLLEQLLSAQPGAYWPSLRQLVGHAQAVEDEQLLGNPFMQLGALLAAGGDNGGATSGAPGGPAPGSFVPSPAVIRQQHQQG